MRKRTGDFGHLKLILAFLFISVVLPNVVKAFDSSAASALGSFEANETGIKLCAQIDAGPEDALHFRVSNNQGYSTDLVVANNSCARINTEAATYTIRQRALQEYSLTSVAGGTVSADSTPFIATASGQYTIIYSAHYAPKSYLHSFGYTVTKNSATAMDIHFDANGGTGTMNDQRFGINASQALTANAFTRAGYTFDGWNTAADGSGTSYTNGQSVSFANGGVTTLYAQWLSPRAADIFASQANDLGDYEIDYTKKAVVSDDIATANGNGVNKYTEKGQDVYYFRGQIDNNNVIWADKCWKIIRTTYTGGIKMIYNGVPTDTVVDGGILKQCLATGTDSQITVNVNGTDKNTFSFNNSKDSPADVGYMYGERIASRYLSAGTSVFIFANDVSRNGNTYTLDTAAGQSISGTWADERANAATRYHYFCTDGSASCDGTKIGYIIHFGDTRYIWYLRVDGHDDIEDMKAAMFANTTDSNAKAMVETWFEQQNLDGHLVDTRNYEEDLEDAIYCNDRSLYSGALKGKDVDAGASYSTLSTSNFGAYGRNAIENVQNNYEPNLDCASINDAFTKDASNGNGMLSHKIGLITEDELTLAGYGQSAYNFDSTAYLSTGQYAWSASPSVFGNSEANVFNWISRSSYGSVSYASAYGLRPVVSLKSSMSFVSGTGLKTDPYIVP